MIRKRVGQAALIGFLVNAKLSPGTNLLARDDALGSAAAARGLVIRDQDGHMQFAHQLHLHSYQRR